MHSCHEKNLCGYFLGCCLRPSKLSKKIFYFDSGGSDLEFWPIFRVMDKFDKTEISFSALNANWQKIFGWFLFFRFRITPYIHTWRMKKWKKIPGLECSMEFVHRSQIKRMWPVLFEFSYRILMICKKYQKHWWKLQSILLPRCNKQTNTKELYKSTGGKSNKEQIFSQSQQPGLLHYKLSIK